MSCGEFCLQQQCPPASRRSPACHQRETSERLREHCHILLLKPWGAGSTFISCCKHSNPKECGTSGGGAAAAPRALGALACRLGDRAFSPLSRASVFIQASSLHCRTCGASCQLCFWII